MGDVSNSSVFYTDALTASPYTLALFCSCKAYLSLILASFLYKIDKFGVR